MYIYIYMHLYTYYCQDLKSRAPNIVAADFLEGPFVCQGAAPGNPFHLHTAGSCCTPGFPETLNAHDGLFKEYGSNYMGIPNLI